MATPGPSIQSIRLMETPDALDRYLEIRSIKKQAARREARRLEEKLARDFGGLVGLALQGQVRKIPRDVVAVIDRDDLRAAGMAGLLEALRTYDPARGAPFASYGTQMARWAMIHQIRDLDMIPRYTRTRIAQADRAAEGMAARLRREPTNEEVAQEAGISRKRYQEHRVWKLRTRPAALPEHDHWWVEDDRENDEVGAA